MNNSPQIPSSRQRFAIMHSAKEDHPHRLHPEVEAVREEIPRIAHRHGAEDVRVFGSAARGELRPDSDIDLLVSAEGETSPWFPAGLVEDLQRLLHRKVDVVTEASLHWYIRDKVVREAVRL